MSLSELNEASWESSGFHATNQFARDIEELHTLSLQTEIAPLNDSRPVFRRRHVRYVTCLISSKIRKLRKQDNQTPRRRHRIAPN